MASDVAGPVRASTRPEQPRLGAAALVAGLSTTLVAGGAVIGVGSLGRPVTDTVQLTGSGSTEGSAALLPGQDGTAYLVVHNGSGGRVRFVRATPGAVTVRPGTAPGCDPSALTVRTEEVRSDVVRSPAGGLEVGPGRSGLVTAHLHLAEAAGDSCRDAVFELPVTVQARRA